MKTLRRRNAGTPDEFHGPIEIQRRRPIRFVATMGMQYRDLPVVPASEHGGVKQCLSGVFREIHRAEDVLEGNHRPSPEQLPARAVPARYSGNDSGIRSFRRDNSCRPGSEPEKARGTLKNR